VTVVRDGEPQIYTALATIRNGYLQGQWQRVQMFLVFNTVAFPLVFGTTQPEEVKFFISVVGLCIHAIILQATLRADIWIKFLDARMIELEGLDPDDASGIRIQVFSHPDFTVKRHSRFASRRSFGIVGLIVATIWVWQTIRYAYTFVH
jgi:hypothetical protein